MLKALLSFILLFITMNSTASALFFTRDMTERIDLSERLFQSSNIPLKKSSTTVKQGANSKQRERTTLFQPPKSLLEEMISQVAPVPFDAKLDKAVPGTEVVLAVTQETLVPFFSISFGKTDATALKNVKFDGVITGEVSGMGNRETIEILLKRNELVKQAVLDLRSFYRETDFSSVNITLGEYRAGFSFSNDGGNVKSRSTTRSLEQKKSENRTRFEENGSPNFMRLIPSFLFSGTFWLLIYVLLCVTIFARGLLRKR